MIYAVFSDVHANVSALERVLEDARSMGAERLLCLGDVVGYGPQPSETLELVRSSGATVLAGNHDDAVSGRIESDDFIDLAGEAVRRHRECLTSEQLAYLRSLAHVATVGAVRAAHGDFTEPESFNYVDSEAAAGANFGCCDFELGFVGHTHDPCIFLTGQSGRVYRLPPQDFCLEEGKRYLVNPGSVGYPRSNDGRCYSSYVVYDSTRRLVRYRFLPFSVSSVMQRGGSARRAVGVRLVVLGAALALALVVAWLGFGLRPSDAPRTEVTETHTVPLAQVATNVVEIPQQMPEKPESTEEALDRRIVEIPLGHHFLRANVRLAQGSASVQLKVVYLDANGNRICEEAVVVKTAQKQRRRLPSGTVRAELTLKHVGGQSQPSVLEFAPETEASPRRVRRQK